jgi:hypothetical protein
MGGVSYNGINLKDEGVYEVCLRCKKITKIRKDMPIELRKNYLYGQGQLCEDCAKK